MLIAARSSRNFACCARDRERTLEVCLCFHHDRKTIETGESWTQSEFSARMLHARLGSSRGAQAAERRLKRAPADHRDCSRSSTGV